MSANIGRVSSYIGKRRLLKLAAYLKTIPKALFDLDTWKTERKLPGIKSCSTTACACGYACDIKSFQRAGLRLSKYAYDSFCKKQDYILRLGKTKLQGFEAAAEFFKISVIDAEYLFNPDRYSQYFSETGVKTTPKQVARRIEQYVSRSS